MAGRIRSIKPEILDDERSAGLSDAAWRLWVSMWLLADDHGRLRGSESWLDAQVFWASRNPRETLANLLESLAAARLVIRYEVEGQKYIEVRNWVKHQKVDHPGKPRVPERPDGVGDSFREDKVTSSRESRESLAKPSESLATDLRPPTSDQRSFAASPQRSRKSKVTTIHPDAPALLAELSAARMQTIPGARPLNPTTENLRHISDRLIGGNAPEDIRHVIAVCVEETKRGSNPVYFDAITPFRPDNFAKKVGASLTARPREPGEPARAEPLPFDQVFAGFKDELR